MSCWCAAVKAMLEITDPCFATSTSAALSPKSNSSQLRDTAEIAPCAELLPLALTPSAEFWVELS